METGVRVFARLRPGGGAQRDIQLHQRYGQQKHVQVRNLEFSLDWVFGEDATQADVFDMVDEGLPTLLEGNNVAVLAYGQTGSGKTYTMFGPEKVLTEFVSSDRALHGVAPRACERLFDEIAESPEETSWLVQCTYLEVYNGVVNDLLGGRKNLVLRETAESGLYVEGLTHEVVPSAEQAMSALARGNDNRTVGAMKMNARSSRGHAIFSLRLQDVSAAGKSHGEAAKMDLVDLAGMESSKKSYAVDGVSSTPMRREEAKHINTSLYALGSVVERLSAGGSSHVPYRDAKLTRLLQDSLNGSSSAALIVTLRRELTNIDETIGTLRFAQRAKAIPVRLRRPKAASDETEGVRAQLDAALAELRETRSTVERLQQQLDHAAAWGGADVAEAGTLPPLLARQNRQLRISLVIQRLQNARQVERMDALTAEHQKAQVRLRELESAFVSVSRDDLPRGGRASPTKGMGSSWSTIRRAVLRSPVTEDQRRYERFQQLATARKLALASKGYEIVNVFIDEMYDEVTRAEVPVEEWHAFLRRQIPSPEPLRAGGGAASPAQMATLHRFAMPFDGGAGEGNEEDGGRAERAAQRPAVAHRARVSPPRAGKAGAGAGSAGARSARAMQLELLEGEERWRCGVDLDAHAPRGCAEGALPPLGSSITGPRWQAASWSGAAPWADDDDPARHPIAAAADPGPVTFLGGLARRASSDAMRAAKKAAAASADARVAAARAVANASDIVSSEESPPRRAAQ